MKAPSLHYISNKILYRSHDLSRAIQIGGTFLKFQTITCAELLNHLPAVQVFL